MHWNKNDIRALFGWRDTFSVEYFSQDWQGIQPKIKLRFPLPRGQEQSPQVLGPQLLAELLLAHTRCAPGGVRTTPLSMQTSTTEFRTWEGEVCVWGIPDDRGVQLRGVDIHDIEGSADGQLPQQGQGTAVHHCEHTCVWGGQVPHLWGPRWRKIYLSDTLNSEGARDICGDLKQWRGHITRHTFRRFSHQTQHTANISQHFGHPQEILHSGCHDVWLNLQNLNVHQQMNR